MNTTTLFEYEKNLQSAKSIEELDKIFQNYLTQLGFVMFSFTYYSYYTNALNKLQYDFASPKFRIWHQHYLAENYHEIDSTLDAATHTSLPILWNLQDQLNAARSEKERQMRLDSIEFGAEKGVSIPIHGPHGDFASFIVVQMKGEKCLEHWEQIQYQLFIVGYYFYFYLQKHLLKAARGTEKNQLTKREVQCLTLVAKQYRLEQIAKKLHITERTVNYHIQRINKKLGTKNKHQSVAKAIRLALIHF